ncbi:hypothetical protein ACFQ07_02710, partial [Actinomadura adrarensis]
MTCAFFGATVLVAPAFAQPIRTLDSPSTPEEQALQQARDTGQPVDVAGRTSEMEKLTALPDGQLALETAPVPVRVNRDGAFHDADLALVRSGGGIASRMSVNGVTFGLGGGDVLATMVKDGKSLTLTWPGGALPEPVLQGDSATYVDAAGAGLDIVVRSTPTGWSHYIVVKTPEAAQNPALERVTFGVRGSGVRLQRGAGGGVAA